MAIIIFWLQNIMKYIFAALLIAYTTLTVAQEKLNPVSTNTSPAASMIRMQPGVLLSPKNNHALEAGLGHTYNHRVDTDPSAVPNLALEFTPFWTNKRQLKPSNYLYPKGLFAQIARTSSFSVGTSSNYLLPHTSSLVGALGYGYRANFKILNKKKRAQVQEYQKTAKEAEEIYLDVTNKANELIEKYQKEEIDIQSKDDFLSLIKRPIYEAFKKYNSPADAETATHEIFALSKKLPALSQHTANDFSESFKLIVKNYLNNYKQTDKIDINYAKQSGFSFDIAYSGLLGFPTNEFNYSRVLNQAIWITPTLRLRDQLNFLKFLLVARYEWYDASFYSQQIENSDLNNVIIYGLGIATEFEKFEIQIEGAYRNVNIDYPLANIVQGQVYDRGNSEIDYLYQARLMYRITPQIAISYAIGNRFDAYVSSDNTLASVFSLNIGLGTPKSTRIIK